MLHWTSTIADKIVLCKPFVRFMFAPVDPGKPVWQAFNHILVKFESCMMQEKMSCSPCILHTFLVSLEFVWGEGIAALPVRVSVEVVICQGVSG